MYQLMLVCVFFWEIWRYTYIYNFRLKSNKFRVNDIIPIENDYCFIKYFDNIC